MIKQLILKHGFHTIIVIIMITSVEQKPRNNRTTNLVLKLAR